MARVYVSGSIRDIDKVQRLRDLLRENNHTITHDWTLYEGPKDSCAEAKRQIYGIQDCDTLVLVEHPRLKAGWMEFGAAAMVGRRLVVLKHPDVSDSMWYSFPRVELSNTPFGVLVILARHEVV